MNIPDQAIEAAAKSLTLTGLREDWEEMSDNRRSVYEHSAEAALQAALPAIEKAIRSEWADYIDSATITVGNTLTLESLADTLRQPGRPFGTEKGNQK